MQGNCDPEFHWMRLWQTEEEPQMETVCCGNRNRPECPAMRFTEHSGHCSGEFEKQAFTLKIPASANGYKSRTAIEPLRSRQRLVKSGDFTRNACPDPVGVMAIFYQPNRKSTAPLWTSELRDLRQARVAHLKRVSRWVVKHPYTPTPGIPLRTHRPAAYFL